MSRTFHNSDGKLSYRYGDEQRPVEVSEVTLKYKDGDNMSERSFEMYHTHHGPVTHMLDGKWVATKINWDPVNALQQSYIRTKQSDHDGFREMMDIRTNSSNNTVYADSQGNIAYYHGNFVPRRDPQFDFSQPVDGSNPATDWQGLHTVDETITLLNPENGWLQNCNSTPFTAAAEFSPKREDYPVYMAPDAESFRGIHAVRVLTGQSDLTLDKLIEIAYDPYLPGFEQLIPGLITAFDESGEAVCRTGTRHRGITRVGFQGIDRLGRDVTRAFLWYALPKRWRQSEQAKRHGPDQLFWYRVSA